MATLPPIRINMPSVKLLRETVGNTLRDEIISGKLPSGAKLTETHLFNQLDLTRHPIRKEGERVMELVQKNEQKSEEIVLRR